MIDTHAHLAQRFQQKVDLSSLKKVILSASSQQDSLDNLKLAANDPKLEAAVGIHPDETGNINDQINFLEKLLETNPQIIAVGECGIDLAVSDNYKQQEQLFLGQIKLAEKFHRPVIVHSRKASDEVLEILSGYKGIKGVIHCYTGGKKRIKRVMDLPGEWYFGIDGNLTYEAGLEEVVKEVPKDRLVLETDTPFLTPIPHRGERNQPAFIKHTYLKTAQLWEMDFDKTEDIIDANASRLFNLDTR